MPKLVIISAPSGAGKTTLCNMLLEEMGDRLCLSISSTTRAPRGSEQHGKDYLFISQDEFKSSIQANGFAEWAEVHGNYYGTSKKVIEDAFNDGKSVLLDIDVQGADLLRKAYPKQYVSVFIAPPDLKNLEDRLRSRGTDSDKTIEKRLENAKKEIVSAHLFDFKITNDDLDRAYQELKSIVEKSLQE